MADNRGTTSTDSTSNNISADSSSPKSQNVTSGPATSTTPVGDGHSTSETGGTKVDVVSQQGGTVVPPAAITTPTTSTAPAAVPVVTTKRKAELLKRARHERRVWIGKAVLPFQPPKTLCGVNDDDLDTTAASSLWSTGNDALVSVQSSLICRLKDTSKMEEGNDTAVKSSPPYIPSATSVLSELYGLTDADGSSTEGDSNDKESLTLDQVGSRVEKLIRPLLDEEDKKKKENGDLAMDDDPSSSLSILSSPTPTVSGGNVVTRKSDTVILAAYHDFLSKLLLPESALLVQQIRNFTLQWQGRWKSSAQSSQAASAINAYIKSTVDGLPNQKAWKDRIHQPGTAAGSNDDDDIMSLVSVRRSAESFVYNHVYTHIMDVLLVSDTDIDNKASNDDDSTTPAWTLPQNEFDDKLQGLQFIQPSHLEIACLADTDDDKTKSESPLDILLTDPIQAMLSIDDYYSPYEKLQRVLAVFKGVNASLAEALNQGDDNTTDKPKKLPSADDILPTIILTCIKARPANLLRNLQFIELFAKPEDLRGEAGYAYTNLYGAVQFLMDLKLDDAAGSTLTITPEDLARGLEQSRKMTDSKRESVLSKANKSGATTDKFNAALSRPDAGVPPFALSEDSFALSVHDVRSARLAGKTVDIGWAKKIFESKDLSKQSHAESSNSVHLPAGFSRSYPFLGTHPHDVRVSELPQLLDEYRLLVEVTERLLSNQASRVAHEKKQRELNRQAALAEEMLLLGMPSSS